MTRLAAPCLALLLAACAALPPAGIALEGIPPAFEMGGRLSVSRGGQGEILRMRWTHSPATDAWVIATPVGTEVARIDRSEDGLTVLRPGEAPVSAASFADLTERLLGAALDERLLVAWLHARPVAGPEGWEVTIDEARPAGSAPLARRITASRGDTTVKLVVDHYRAGTD